MSWIFGIIGKGTLKFTSNSKTIASESLIIFSEEELFICSGGNRNTCFFSQYGLTRKRFIAVGVGIDVSSLPYRLLDSEGWKRCTNQRTIGDLNGHYIHCGWDENFF